MSLEAARRLGFLTAPEQLELALSGKLVYSAHQFRGILWLTEEGAAALVKGASAKLGPKDVVSGPKLGKWLTNRCYIYMYSHPEVHRIYN